MAEQQSPVWFITGCSSGFGRELVKGVLDKGWRVVATARDSCKIADLVAGSSDRAVALPLDVTKPEQIEAAVAEAKRRFGRIDVLVNNAGYGYASTIEEGEDAQVRAMFDTNVFGLAAVVRKVLPILRAQGSGTIVNLSSQAGLFGNPGTGYYAASKFAVEGLSDALAKELEPLGIHVLLVEPGPFRTSFTGSTVRADNLIADYEQTAGARIKRLRETANRPGDPVRAAAAIITAVTAEAPPLRLLLGANALRDARAKINLMARDFDAWEQVTLEADYPEFRAPAK
ncbi:SDR family NAD(P)-dependent oxidoreductase [Starkeya sp. ORNL1]|uniref:oxidoreductase n=1 Tax=Starkeya sp. ORNL1 TaxID=2709380 RepID=UPI001462BE83|nr:oxidoreductase [Starkeya sp. ORNL1]QJP15054.1 SDR family NAD(P)-dependent oxidoreductase [Starkeya sp. ORNL1]